MRDDLKKLYVKRQYGGQLTEAENRQLDAWIAAEGREYAAAADEFSSILKEVAMIQVKPMDSSAMVERFEDMIRQNIRSGHRLLYYVVPAQIVLLLVGILMVFLSTSRNDQLLGAFSIGMAMLILLLLWAAYRQNRRKLEDPDLIATLHRERALARTWRVRLNGWILLGITLSGFAWIMYVVGGKTMLINYLICLPFSIAWTYWLLPRYYRRKHRELWEWFENEAA